MYTAHPSDHLCSPSLLLLNKYIGKEDFAATTAGNNSYTHLLIGFFLPHWMWEMAIIFSKKFNSGVLFKLIYLWSN